MSKLDGFSERIDEVMSRAKTNRGRLYDEVSKRVRISRSYFYELLKSDVPKLTNTGRSVIHALCVIFNISFEWLAFGIGSRELGWTVDPEVRLINVYRKLDPQYREMIDQFVLNLEKKIS